MDPDTFLTTFYVLVDDGCRALPTVRRRGPAPALTRSEAVTLALFSQWGRFGSERDSDRYADRRLRGAFPRLPDRSQVNRRIRHERETIVAVGQAALGRSSRLGWFEGFAVLIAARPDGVITGHGFGPGDAKDQPLAETFFAARRAADPRLPSVGRASGEPYVADSGFLGARRHADWAQAYGACVRCPPDRPAARNGPPALRRRLGGLRRVIETVNGTLVQHFRLDRDRPHALDGFAARLAAKVALHHACCWLNRPLGRPTLAFADLLGW